MILVTGGTGLVGAHLLHTLTKEGNKVRAIYRSEQSLDYVRELFRFYNNKQLHLIQWIEADLLDYFSLLDALKGIDKVFHCAAMVSFKPSDRMAMFTANVDGTANLVNASIECGVERFCHVSSIATLGKTQNGQQIDETTFWQNDDNHSVYSQSKFRAEMEVWRGTKEGLKALVVNPSVILGPCPGDKSSGQLIHTLSKNMLFYTGGGSGFVDVRDVTKAMVTLAESEVVNERFIINGENLSYKELMTTAAEVFGVKAPSIKANRWLTGIAWRWERLQYMLFRRAPKMTKETARTSQNQSKYSISKLQEVSPMAFLSIKEALENAKAYQS
ncbi:NAD-dependent epimerase/dehydratase family protein [Carboxylicivirga mesophila]|uniref:NAD-dependent epimerase/dehydratase family protein n=1 Tax=Carboxylicivirga mesophila TaxID=1166478 RepID=A0ABS5K6I1_9BACT|nr:NAD-dependent epimerase/dehydratase family protein [Carboxylicivirga mesophila]MBS2209973.1 NAD-dependent epimerase/dehydratase family protein [Carboxylicivirga mesophila]